MGACAEPQAASARPGKAGALLGCAALSSLRLPCGRTGAVRGPHQGVARSSEARHAAQRVSAKAWGEGHPRMTTCSGPPQVGPWPTRGGGRRGGWSSRGCPCPSLRRRVASGTAPRAWRTPQCRTVTQPSGQTGGRQRRSNARTSSGGGRRRALPTGREGQGPGRSSRPTRRRWAMATVQTEGAREVQAEEPWGWACRWPCPGSGPPWGALGSSRPACGRAAVQRARERGARALPGTKQVAREGPHPVRSLARPPPGTMAWRGGWSWRGRPHGGRTSVHPGRSVPTTRSSWARRVRAVAEACNRAWDARRCGARRQGRSVSGTVKVRRPCGPGSGWARWG